MSNDLGTLSENKKLKYVICFHNLNTKRTYFQIIIQSKPRIFSLFIHFRQFKIKGLALRMLYVERVDLGLNYNLDTF